MKMVQNILTTWKLIHVFESLYSSDSPPSPDELEKFFRSLQIPSVSADHFRELEQDLTVTEITLAIRNMQSGKAPGPDGFSANFYKKFSDQLSPLLLSVFEQSLTSKPPSMREAVISLLAKKGKDCLSCSSYLPSQH